MKTGSMNQDVRSKIFLMALTVFFLSIPTLSIAGLVGSNIPISSRAYDQQNPHTIYLSDPANPANGLWFVVWEDWRNFVITGADIRGRFIKADGSLCGGEFIISSASGNQTVPRAAYRLADGKIVVVWQDTRRNYLFYNTITGINFTTCTATVGTQKQIGYNQIKEYDYSTLHPANTSQSIGTGNGSNYTFTNILTHRPVVPESVIVRAGNQILVDNGDGTLGTSFESNGTINYNSGFISVFFSLPPGNSVNISSSYSYFTSFPPGKVSVGDKLISRQLPRIAYDPTGDRFWIVWKETRNILHNFSQLCFASRVGYIAGWSFDDPDFIGYVRLNGSTLAEQNSIIGIPGADIIRNLDTSTVRLISSSILPLTETREYESFHFATHPDVACDTTSTQCLIAFEGTRTKETLTCDCTDKNGNGICDLADIVSDTLVSAPFDDGNVHVYGISDNYIPLATVNSMKLDSATGTTSHYPSVGFDPITKRFLTAWEDMRDGPNTKVYGQLVLSGGGEYNSDFIISYQDTNGDGQNDANVVNSKQTRPFVSYDPVNQRFFVIWQDARNGTLSLENLDIYGQKVDAEGSLRGNNYAIFTLPYNQYYPTIAYNDVKNQFLTVWKDARNTDNNTCSTTGGVGTGTSPCGSDVYGQRFTLGQPSLTLLKLDNTPLTPPLLSGYENPAGSGGVAVGLSDAKSFKIRNTGDTVLKIDYINEDLSCNGSTPPRDITPFSFDGLPSQLMYRDGNTLNLVPSAELTLTVRFEPKAGGSYNKCFIIESDGGSPQVNLSALAKESNIAISSPGVTYNFGNVYIGSYGEETFVVKNTGTANLKISSLNNPLTPFSIKSDGCSGKDITPGSTCNIVARFTPKTTGSFNSKFGINSNDPDTPILNISLSGIGLGAQDITVTPLSINFGNVQKGQNSQQAITIKNDGTKALTINSISKPLAPFSIVSNTCPLAPATLGIGISCQVTVRFAPSSTGATSSGITISSNDPDEGTVTVSLSGTGVVVPDISVVPAFVNFPSTVVGSSSQKNITVSNIGTANLSISGLTNPSGDFSIVSSNCIGTITPSGKCTITVSFSPASAGYKTSSFTINSNDPDTPSFTVALSGTGAVLPDITVTPTALAFGSHLVGTATDLNVTILNDGNANLNITSVSNPSQPYSITSNTCSGIPVQPAKSCQITVRFAPTSVGAFNSSITISSNDPDEGSVKVNITGTGVEPQNIQVSPTLVDFGTVKVGTISSPRKVSITNSGGSDLVITSIIYPGTPYIVTSDTCKGKTITPQGTCSLTVVFNPTRSGYFYPYYLTINSNDPDQPKVKVTLKGIGVL